MRNAKPSDFKFLKYFFFSLGSLAWLLGIIGIVVPLLPTTPFLLLAVFCYAKSSEKFFHLLRENKIFGRYIIQWQEHKKIPPKAKVYIILLIVLSISVSLIFIIHVLRA